MRWGKKLDAAVAGMRSGRCPNVSSITRPSSEAAHLRERRWQTDPRSRMADLIYAEKDDRWHHAGPQCQGRNRLSQNGEPSWQPSLRPKFGLLAGLKTVVDCSRDRSHRCKILAERSSALRRGASSSSNSRLICTPVRIRKMALSVGFQFSLCVCELGGVVTLS